VAIIVLLVLLLLVAVGGLTVLVAVLIRRVGSDQQQQYDAEVSQFIAGMQPDAEFQQRQAEIERNLADADALAARVEAASPPAQPIPQTTSAPPTPPPEPTL
jgi:hypothetical protein